MEHVDLDESEQLEYEDSEYEAWKRSAPTRRLVKANKERLVHQRQKLEGAARRSSDPEVREAMAELWAARVIIAELEGSDSVGGGE